MSWYLGAEMLKKSKLKVMPFISSYRTTAFIVIGVLFVLEIICSSLRAFGQNLPLGSTIAQISAVVYCIVALTLTVCYLVCAVGIFKKLKQMPGASTKRHPNSLLALRVAMSSAGYLMFVGATVGFAIAFRAPWGRQITMNLAFIGHNFAATMQIVATRPHGRKGVVSSSSSQMPQHYSSASNRFGSSDSAEI
jgi:hypothetical protein